MSTTYVYVSTADILHLAASIGLALLALLATLRWPAVRGKHVLCAAFALNLGAQLASVVCFLMLRRGVTLGDRMLDALGWLTRLSGVLVMTLLLVFTVIMGMHLREREADNHET